MIRSIGIANVKSIVDLEMELGRVNIIIKHIIAHFLKSKNIEVEAVQLQPKRGGKGMLEYGTWHNVFEYIHL